MDLKAWSKHLALSFLPRRIREYARERYYRQVLSKPLRELEQMEPDLKVVSRVVQPGDSVVDVGANYGIYTKCLAELVGRDGKVFAFEPIPETAALLKKNIAALRLSNVVVSENAVSNREGLVRMVVPRWNHGPENFYQAHVVRAEEGEPSGPVHTVPTTTLDALAPLARISFIKCDVEGHEATVLAGGEKLLARDEPALLVEVSGDPDQPTSQAAQVILSLAKRGYGCYRRDGATIAPRRPGDRAVNYFFLQSKHLRALGLDRAAAARDRTRDI